MNRGAKAVRRCAAERGETREDNSFFLLAFATLRERYNKRSDWKPHFREIPYWGEV